MTDPDWEPIMKVAGAIVANKVEETCLLFACIYRITSSISAIVFPSDCFNRHFMLLDDQQNKVWKYKG
jgi:phosphoenolpyruvate synthase/pyruvate phosphate dikinase